MSNVMAQTQAQAVEEGSKVTGEVAGAFLKDFEATKVEAAQTPEEAEAEIEEIFIQLRCADARIEKDQAEIQRLKKENNALTADLWKILRNLCG
ncbi:MAG: hypothetical protein GDA44_05475 [Prochloron sp. SP5CPC1]|nr:hypothetical protein [Candidatus Paraprochloron terpiosi SP5CPC1]